MLRLLVVIGFLVLPAAASAQEQAKPYEEQMSRLAEVLGSLHFLRRLCNADEGPRWRVAMAELLEAEQPSDARRTALTARFNRGYGAFSRSYTTCTPAAVRAAELYRTEGLRLASQIVSRYAR